jgi:hypothetical protein
VYPNSYIKQDALGARNGTRTADTQDWWLRSPYDENGAWFVDGIGRLSNDSNSAVKDSSINFYVSSTMAVAPGFTLSAQ